MLVNLALTVMSMTPSSSLSFPLLLVTLLHGRPDSR